MTHQEIIYTNDIANNLRNIIERLAPNVAVAVTDNNVRSIVADVLYKTGFDEDKIISIAPGDENKSIESVCRVWSELQRCGATRKSLVVNIGGGVVTDLGGFAAATYKRGIRFVNVPTTLLSAVDAAVGGKTGVNFNGFKNEVGVFKEAEAVIISSMFFGTLPDDELKSGYAEMIKHGMLSGEAVYERLLDFDFKAVDGEHLLALLQESVEVKREIVIQDPFEKGLRRALNLGHTAGHAFESLALKRGKPIPHGYAVAWGLVVESVLSHTEKGLPSAVLYRLVEYISSHYGAFHITCDDYPILLELMRHDKKSESGEFNFSLLRAIGKVETGCIVASEKVEAALDVYRDLMHI